MGSSQQVSELKLVDLGALGSLIDCGVSQTLPRMEWAGKRGDFQVRSAPGLDCFPHFLAIVLGCFLGGKRVSLLSIQDLGLRNDVIFQQLDSISLRRRERANFLDFTNVADVVLNLRFLNFTIGIIILLLFSKRLRVLCRKSPLYRKSKLSSPSLVFAVLTWKL